MRAYQTYRFHEMPDVADIREDGRKSCVGRLDEKGYFRDPRRKAATRRYLKRADKARAARLVLEDFVPEN